MARTTTERALNPHGRVYLLDGLTKLHICKICGTCERRNGQYWWAGKWSKTEPPCGLNTEEQRDWHNNANPDNEDEP